MTQPRTGVAFFSAHLANCISKACVLLGGIGTWQYLVSMYQFLHILHSFLVHGNSWNILFGGGQFSLQGNTSGYMLGYGRVSGAGI